MTFSRRCSAAAVLFSVVIRGCHIFSLGYIYQIRPIHCSFGCSRSRLLHYLEPFNWMERVISKERERKTIAVA
ncbi:hypothetical protein F4774DRAFT_367897 [Daldinia eschscholtzii]|nr:hypothetical protein F4774DRAFT_367897 [Daldinia eschscholtzii]